ncbi:MAG: GDSL-type esterase/lipase family protein [Cypionkella sp.]|uniref:SGNH/GDSL hydrolase family protein n=1 Tax=Cypionkella sp. TaxID=2811411 RepID=UPI002ABCAA47|nr:GDSL-type esterase/lipase family protein [Cypionkella sp.]MDZ4310613.1 GDSL-type esterase/lipase family protein [Cypionkella sp.]
MEAGVTSNMLDPASIVDTVMANRGGKTVQILIASLAQQLATVGPFLSPEALEPLSDALEALQSVAFDAAPTFDTTALGLAGTTVAGLFSVPVLAGGIEYRVYRHDAGPVANLLREVPSASALAAKANQSDLSSTQQGLNASFDVAKVAVAARIGGAFFDLAGGAYDWGIGFVGGVDVAAGAAFNTCRFALQISSDAVQVRYRLWSRPLAAAWMATGPGDASDTQHGTTATLTPAALGLIPGGPRGVAAFPLGASVTIEAGRLYIHEIEALDAGGTRVLSAIEYKLQSGLTTDQYRKWRRAGAPANAWSNQVASTTFVYCYELQADGFDIKAAAAYLSSEVIDCVSSISGMTVNISGHVSADGGRVPFAGAVVLDAATSGTVTDEPAVLKALTGGARVWSYMPTKLARANLRSVVIKDAATAAVLTNTTDYLLIAEHGCISLPAQFGADRNVLVSYEWSQSRYDLIYLDLTTMAIGVIKGVEADRDCAERIPAIGAVGRLPLAHVYIHYPGNDVVEVWDVEAGYRRKLSAQARKDRSRNRSILRPVMKGLMNPAKTVTLIGYGDSNVAQQSVYNSALNSTPNSIYHDRAKDGMLFNPPFGADILTGIATYDTGDGQGQVHTRFGYMWELKAALEEAYPAAISYLNMGVGGTTAAATISGSVMSGGYATRLGYLSTQITAAKVNGPVLVVIQFGANDQGSDVTLNALAANVGAIITSVKGQGAVPLVLGSPRPNAYDFNVAHTTSRWRTAQTALRRAAEYYGAAYVPTEDLYLEGYSGALGLSPLNTSSATLDVHQAPREMKVIGARMAAEFGA